MSENIKITMKTDKGNLSITIYAADTPMTAASFLNLANRGYYDGITFHRVIPDFMIQGGDPTGTGTSGPGYQFGDECLSSLKHDKPGILSMANAGPGTNGSQFFITHGPQPHLDGKHTVFGHVTEGQEVVDSIEQGDSIVGIDVHDSTEELFAQESSKIEEWNKVLN